MIPVFLKNVNHLTTFQHAIALTKQLVTSGTRSPTLILPYAPMPSFEDSDLEGTYHKFLSASNIGPTGEDLERPHKRARLSTVNEQGMIHDVRFKIVASIHDLLGFEQDDQQGGLGPIPV